MFVRKRPKINEKEAGNGPFFKKKMFSVVNKELYFNNELLKIALISPRVNALKLCAMSLKNRTKIARVNVL